MLDKDTIISLANEAGIKGPAPARQGFKMYASPQRLMTFAGLVTSKREWVGLTDEESVSLLVKANKPTKGQQFTTAPEMAANFGRLVSELLKERNSIRNQSKAHPLL